jgi:flagellar biosynthesis/type III secretory pathway chaperone
MKKEEMRELTSIFKQHTAVLNDLHERLQEEREALVKDDTAALVKAVEKKAGCADQLEKFEKIRLEKYADVALSTLEEAFKEGYEDEEEKVLAAALKEQMHFLQSQSEALWREQETNTMLIQQSMAYADMLMRTLQDIVKKTGTYGKDGKIDQSPSVQAGLDRSV